MNLTLARIDVDGVAHWQVRDGDGRILVDVAATGTGEDDVALAHRSATVELATVVGDALAHLAVGPEDEEGEELAQGARFRLTFEEGDRSVDGRIIEPDATNFDRQPPLPVMLLTEEPPWGHEGAQLAGVVDNVGRSGRAVFLEGRFDPGSEAGREAERLVAEGILETWSPDLSPDSEVEFVCEESDDDGWCVRGVARFMSTTILGGTIAPFPALTSARVELIEEGAPPPAEPAGGGDADTGGDDDEDAVDEATAAQPVVAAGYPARPPADWFADPGFDELTPLTVGDDGRVFGHLAAWETCHTGSRDVCVCTPHSASGYAYFTTGYVETAEGTTVPTGPLTIGGGHADLRLDFRGAVEHYDDSGAAVADVAVGEDEHGIWFAGGLRPGVTDDQLRELCASSLSGDWRPIGGELEMVAALGVNQPGFPVPRARVASGATLALVASGAGPVGRRLAAQAEPWRASHERLERRLGDVERALSGLRALGPAALDAARAQLRGDRQAG